MRLTQISCEQCSWVRGENHTLQRPSETLRDHRTPLETIGDYPRLSETIKDYQIPSTTIKDHYGPSEIITDHRSPSQMVCDGLWQTPMVFDSLWTITNYKPLQLQQINEMNWNAAIATRNTEITDKNRNIGLDIFSEHTSFENVTTTKLNYP